MQRIMQLTHAQKTRLLAMRQTFIIQLALITARRQELLQQLQVGAESMGCSNQEMYHEQLTVEDITQKLQESCVLRHKLWTQYYIAINQGVGLCQSTCRATNEEFAQPVSS